MFRLIPMPGDRKRHPEQLPLAFLGQAFAIAVVITLFVIYVSGLGRPF